MKTINLGHRLVPALLVRDMRQTLAFYQQLGFQLNGSNGAKGETTWAEVQRDGVVFQFHTEAPGGTPTAPACSGTFYLYPDDVMALAAELRGKVEFAWGPEVMDYGMREFGIQDPDGYHLAFAEPA